MKPYESVTRGDRCNQLSRRVEILCGLLVVSELALLVQAVSGASPGGSFAASFWIVFSLVWVLWIVTQVENYRLVRCGPHAQRYALAGRTINRPQFTIRMTFHLLINWSPIAAALLAGLVIQGDALTTTVGRITIASAIAAWLLFNVLHRQVNRLRNLTTTTVIAVALIIASIILISK